MASEKIGRETVTYVANIDKYYAADKLITETDEQQRKERGRLEAAPQKLPTPR